MEPIRLQKYLSRTGTASRRKAEELITAGSVTVNGHPATLGMSVDPSQDIVAVNGERVWMPEGFHYIMLYKPRGYVTTLSDERGRRCIADLIKDIPGRVYPVGRLDRDSEGLLLLTDDGELANQLMHPRYHIPKVYRATLRPEFREEHAIRLLEGIELDGEKCQPVPSRVLVQEPNRSVVELVLHEGRNRQIRRMCEQMGLEVARLRRTSIGPVRLGMLQPGKWRELEKAELASLRRDLQKAMNRAESGQEPEAYVWDAAEPVEEDFLLEEEEVQEEKKTFSERKPYGEKKFSDGKRAYGDGKSYGEKKSYGERKITGSYTGERKSYGNRSYGEKKFSGEKKTYGEKSYGEKKSYGERKTTGSYTGERKSYGNRSEGRSYGNKKTYTRSGNYGKKPENKQD